MTHLGANPLCMDGDFSSIYVQLREPFHDPLNESMQYPPHKQRTTSFISMVGTSGLSTLNFLSK